MASDEKLIINYEYVNTFIFSAIKVFREMLDLEVSKKKIYVEKGKTSIGGVGIILDITGDNKIRVVCELSKDVTIRFSTLMIEHSIVENFLKGQNKQDLKLLLESAIAELGNIITGNAITILNDKGIGCSISPPKIFMGKGIKLIPSDFYTIVIELISNYGDFIINLAIKDI